MHSIFLMFFILMSNQIQPNFDAQMLVGSLWDHTKSVQPSVNEPGLLILWLTARWINQFVYKPHCSGGWHAALWARSSPLWPLYIKHRFIIRCMSIRCLSKSDKAKLEKSHCTQVLYLCTILEVLGYFYFLLLYTLPLHLGGKYCIFNCTTFIW